MLRIVTLIALLCLLAAPAAAQDERPLVDMLSLIPASEFGVAQSFVSYVDYEAVFAQRDGLNPQTAAEFDMMVDMELDDVWFANAQRIQSGSGNVVQYLQEGYPDSLELHGFEWFDIDQSLSFGIPPAQGAIFGGDFNLEAVTEAFTARGYEAVDLDGVTTLCPLEGCDAGMMLDIPSRNPAIIFGGQLGRRELVALRPGLLLNSPSLETVEAMIAAESGAPSLMDVPDYQALVKALYTPEAAQLVQVNILDAADIVDFTIPADLNLDPADLEPLPPYTLMALADYQVGDEQLVQVLLVYEDEASAQASAMELGQRIEDIDFGGFFIDVNARLDDTEVITTSDRWVVVAGVRYPLPPNEPAEGERLLTPSGVIYRNWLSAIYRREFVPIITESSLVTP
jgi:hypothetical protein